MKLSEQLSKFTEGSARGYSSLVTGNVYAENWSYAVYRLCAKGDYRLSTKE